MSDRLLNEELQKFVAARAVKARLEKLLPGIQVTKAKPDNRWAPTSCIFCNGQHEVKEQHLGRDKHKIYGESYYVFEFYDPETQMKSREMVCCADETACQARQFKRAVKDGTSE